VNVERTIRIVDQVRTKVAEGSLHNSFVFLRGAVQTVIGREFPNTRAYELHRNVAVSIHHNHACRIGAVRVEFAAIRGFDVD
jgi:hypothetical protein